MYNYTFWYIFQPLLQETATNTVKQHKSAILEKLCELDKLTAILSSLTPAHIRGNKSAFCCFELKLQKYIMYMPPRFTILFSYRSLLYSFCGCLYPQLAFSHPPFSLTPLDSLSSCLKASSRSPITQYVCAGKTDEINLDFFFFEVVLNSNNYSL